MTKEREAYKNTDSNTKYSQTLFFQRPEIRQYLEDIIQVRVVVASFTGDNKTKKLILKYEKALIRELKGFLEFLDGEANEGKK